MCDNDLISCHLTGDIYATTDEERVNKCLRFACHSLDCKFALFTNKSFWKVNPHWFCEAVIESYCNSISLAKKFWMSTGFLHIPLLFLRLTLRDRYHRGDARLTAVLLTAQFRTHQHASAWRLKLRALISGAQVNEVILDLRARSKGLERILESYLSIQPRHVSWNANWNNKKRCSPHFVKRLSIVQLELCWTNWSLRTNFDCTYEFIWNKLDLSHRNDSLTWGPESMSTQCTEYENGKGFNTS